MNYISLTDAVNAKIKANGKREITGDVLNDVLRAMIEELGAGYQIGGTLRPDDKPMYDGDLRIAYLAVEPGMYEHAGGFEVTELSLITYGAEWYIYPLGVPFGSQIAEGLTTEMNERKAADTALETRVTTLESKIPVQADLVDIKKMTKREEGVVADAYAMHEMYDEVKSSALSSAQIEGIVNLIL